MNIREFSRYLAKNTNGEHFCQKPIIWRSSVTRQLQYGASNFVKYNNLQDFENAKNWILERGERIFYKPKEGFVNSANIKKGWKLGPYLVEDESARAFTFDFKTIKDEYALSIKRVKIKKLTTLDLLKEV